MIIAPSLFFFVVLLLVIGIEHAVRVAIHIGAAVWTGGYSIPVSLLLEWARQRHERKDAIESAVLHAQASQLIAAEASRRNAALAN